MIIKCRLDEVPIVGQRVIDALKARLADFVAYKSTKYTGDFMTSLDEELQAMSLIINPVVITRELKEITLRMTVNIMGLRVTMNLLEGYIADATDLTVAKKDFGTHDVRKKIVSGDVEGVNGALGLLLTNITNNMPKLTAVGYTPAMKTALEDMRNSIFTDNGEQYKKLEARMKLVRDNITTINAFLSKIKGVMDDGKRLYSINDKDSAKQFTLAYILRMLRNDELHTLISGKVYKGGNETVSKVKVKAKPSVEGKRSKTVTTNTNGYYELRGLKPVNYIITFTYPDGKTFVTNIDAKTNETVTLDFHQPEPE